ISVNAEGEKDLEYEVIQVDGSVARDPALAPVVEEYGDNMENTLGDTIAQAEGDFTFLDNAYLVADAFRNYEGTDLGWMNGGGIGNGITTTGDITYETAYSMLSFGNKVMSI
ncbi:hypothetical protein CVR96_26570, partial [Salmonella enterica subsp. enterica serovar Typhimurium]|uniref:5'-nucleotidase C-terminal domain-containing protein n=1 Tax=Salmonella enterica TaxID=28901 RepID=UPI000CBAA52D